MQTKITVAVNQSLVHSINVVNILNTEASRAIIAVTFTAVKGNFQKILLLWEISLLGLDSCCQISDSDLPGDRQIINLSWQPF